MRPVGRSGLRLLLLGSATRLGIASLVVVLLWAAFFWATATPGGL